MAETPAKPTPKLMLTVFLFFAFLGMYHLHSSEQDAPLRVLFQRNLTGGNSPRDIAIQKLESDLATIAFDCYQISRAPHPTLEGVHQRYVEPLEYCVSHHLGDHSALDSHTKERFYALRVDNHPRARGH